MTTWLRGRIALQESALAAVVVALLVAGTILKPDVFFTSSNLLNVLTQASIVGIVAVGMTFVIATGGIDLSVGSALAAASIVGAKLSADVDIVFILGALGAGVAIGAFNALAVTLGRIAPFIATLAMFTIARGLALRISDKTPISAIGLDTVHWLGGEEILGIPVPALVFLLLTALGWVVLNRTAYGRHVIAVGGNAEAARIAGVRVEHVRFGVYVIIGLCVGISAVLLTGRLASASPVSGSLLELDAIAAVVIGGTSLAGGRATMTGTFLGVITFALIFNLLNLLNLPAELQQIVKGVIVLAAVAVQRWDRR